LFTDAAKVNAGVTLHRQSGYRPLKYQEHFKDIRDVWNNLYDAIHSDPRVADICAKESEEVMREIRDVHHINQNGVELGGYLTPLEATQRAQPASGLHIGSPTVANESNHPSGMAVDLGPKVDVVNNNARLTELAARFGLSHPYISSDKVHFELNTSVLLPAIRIAALSPIALLVTDPVGRRIGYDPATGALINELGPRALINS